MLETVFTSFRAVGLRMAAVVGLLAVSSLPLLGQINPGQVAILKWYTANKTTSFASQSGPWGMAYDGANMWVANSQSNSVSKFRVSDGANLGNFPIGHPAQLLAYDGVSIWAGDGGTGKVTKIRTSDGAILFDKAVTGATGFPMGLAFDGSSMWVPGSGDLLLQLRISDGATLSAWYVACQASQLAFDGTNVWAACTNTHQVAKQPVAGGTFTLQTVGNWPLYIAFDGTSIWVANNNAASTIQKLRLSDMAILGTYTVSSGAPTGIAFDGVSIWTGTSANTLVKVRPSDGAVLATIPASGSFPLGLAFDGANIWASNTSSATVSKY